MTGELTHASATRLAGAIRAGEVSSRQVVEAHLERIRAVNPELNAVVRLAEERALQEAKRADESLARGEAAGPLHGVPVTIKDSFDTEGIVSSAGTSGRADFVPAEDATVVARLRAAGAIVLGKTNTPELTLSFVTDNALFGRTNNPYDIGRSPGGSSGGAAAIIAAGGSPLDLGSDTAGSIRVPAHFCGIAGLKPTAGRVPRTGHIIPFGGPLDGLTQIGPMARFVEDLALVLPLLCGPDWRDPSIVPMPLGNASSVRADAMRVAFYTDNGICPVTPDTQSAVQRAARALSDLGAVVSEDRPEVIAESDRLLVEIFRADGGAWIRRLLERAGTTQVYSFLEWVHEGDSAEAPTPAEFSRRLEQWDAFRSRMLAFMEGFDAVLAPVNAAPAHEHGQMHRAAFSYTMAYNQTGWPVVVVRAGQSREGLPIGVQVVARPWREDVALALAAHLERELGGWRPAEAWQETSAPPSG